MQDGQAEREEQLHVPPRIGGDASALCDRLLHARAALRDQRHVHPQRHGHHREGHTHRRIAALRERPVEGGPA